MDKLAEMDLAGRLGDSLIRQEPHGAEPYYSVPEAALAQVAAETGATLRAVMIACLGEGIWPERFRPNRGSFSAEDQARLLGSRVLVVGAGGLGGMVITALARVGVGRLTVCDGDVFEESNLNRQLLCRQDRLGRSKALCAAEEVAAINPVVKVRALNEWATAGNLPKLLAGMQVALDCLDNLPARYMLEEAAREAGVPYVHGAVGGLEGFVMTVMPGDPGLAGLYGPDPVAKGRGAEGWLGVPTPTPALIGALQVNEAVRVILGRPSLNGGRFAHLDLTVPSLEVLGLAVEH